MLAGFVNNGRSKKNARIGWWHVVEEGAFPHVSILGTGMGSGHSALHKATHLLSAPPNSTNLYTWRRIRSRSTFVLTEGSQLEVFFSFFFKRYYISDELEY